MHIKIYFDNKPLIICNEIDAIVEPYTHRDDVVFIDELNSHTVKTIIHEMKQSKVHAAVFIHTDFEKLKHDIFKKFIVQQAAGGAVYNEANELLFIFRRGKWDLPKGKLDPNESLEECAIREVEEETGLSNVQLIAPLITTYHTYDEGTRHILKQSHWYTMRVTGAQSLTPQTEEDIHEIKWVPKDDWNFYLQNSFPSINDVLQALQ